MNVFLILQILFDAVLLFGMLFLFHFSVSKTRKKEEDLDALKNLQTQEMKEGLQELLLTLKQLGKEVSENVQDQVREAEDKTEIFKKVLAKLKRDLNRALTLAEEVNLEREHLENKMSAIQAAKKKKSKSLPSAPTVLLDGPGELREAALEMKNKMISRSGFGGEKNKAVGFSSGVVREIYRLADDELGVNEIVLKTKLSRAEVQLILNLRGNRFSTPN